MIPLMLGTVFLAYLRDEVVLSRHIFMYREWCLEICLVGLREWEIADIFLLV